MRKVIMLIMVLMMAPVTFAAPEEVSLGPYRVEFDLNTTENYNLTIGEPIIGEEIEIEPNRSNSRDLYSLNINLDDGSGASITITKWLKFSDATFMENIVLQRLMYECYGYDHLAGGYLEIDGKQGYLMTAEGEPALRWGERNFIAWYWLDKVDMSNSVVSYGKNRVSVTGNISSEVTEQLLQTIYVV